MEIETTEQAINAILGMYENNLIVQQVMKRESGGDGHSPLFYNTPVYMYAEDVSPHLPTNVLSVGIRVGSVSEE